MNQLHFNFNEERNGANAGMEWLIKMNAAIAARRERKTNWFMTERSELSCLKWKQVAAPAANASFR